MIDNADRLSEDNVLEKFGVFDKCGKIISDSARGLAMVVHELRRTVETLGRYRVGDLREVKHLQLFNIRQRLFCTLP